MLLFAGALAVFSAVVFGLVPAWDSARVALADALGSGTRTTAGKQRGRSVLVAAELALAMVLLVSSALMIRGTARILHGDQGYNPYQLLTAALDLPEVAVPDDESRRQTMLELLSATRAIP